MPPRTTTAPRTRASVIGLIALGVLAAFLWYVRSHAAGNGKLDGGADAADPPRSEIARPASADAGPAAEEEERKLRELAENYRIAAQEATRRFDRRRSYLDPGYQLTQEFLDDFEFSGVESARAQKVLDAKWAELAERAASGLVYDAEASAKAEKKGTRIFRLPAMESEAERVDMLSRLQQSLKDATDRHLLAFEYLPEDADLSIMYALALDPSFAYMGKYASEIRFTPGEDTVLHAFHPAGFAPDETYQIDVRFLGAAGEADVYQAKASLKALGELYGRIFKTAP